MARIASAASSTFPDLADGRLVGEHEGGYLPFDYTVTGLSKGLHTIVVRVDNRLTDKSLPKKNVDWFPYGGIDRPVYLEYVWMCSSSASYVFRPDSALGRCPENQGHGSGSLRCPERRGGLVRVDGQDLVAGKRRAAPGENIVELEAKLSAVKFGRRRIRTWVFRAGDGLDGGNRDDQFTRFG